jgi:outer membrane protein TolC
LIERYKQQQKMVDYTRDFMILMDKKYRQGISNIRDMLEANNEYIEEKSELNNLFYQVKIAEVNYLKAVGNLELLLN